MIYQLMYASSAKKGLEEEDLQDILAVSRLNNAPLDITGLLLYHDGNFIQVLEGPKRAVQGTYDRIVQDGRHLAIQTLLIREVENRLFPDWTMGYKRISDVPQEDQAAFREFFTDILTDESFRSKPDRVVILLKALLRSVGA